jgi:tetratricopeptide (TPR) repeat protein
LASLLRILCLFEQDILEVHKYLVEVLKDGGYTLIEFKIFNWEDESYIEELKSIVKHQFPHHKFEDTIKESGYKSIHYVVTYPSGGHHYPVEIQLRTLLQDVWGELEHAVAYKQGNIHPHIKSSFRLLSKDLQNNDALISHLRDIRDKEYRIELFALEDAGPCAAFSYEPELLSTIFKSDGPLGNAYKDYDKHISEWNRQHSDPRIWGEKGFELYRAVDSLIGYEQRNESTVQYWLIMEKGLLNFLQGRMTEAMRAYEEVTNRWPDLYAPYFRIGEIFYIGGEIERSLIAFDKSEELLLNNKNYDPYNAYRLKVRLANLYWLMGKEYCNMALSKILEAEVIYKEHSASFPSHIKQSLINNLCWYHLDKYILAREKYKQTGEGQDFKAQEQAYENALSRYQDLESLLEVSKEKRANDYDTAA